VDEMISAQDRVALLREGIVVLSEDTDGQWAQVCVTGEDEERVREIVAARVGAAVEVRVCGELPHELWRRRCRGYVARGPATVGLRFEFFESQHLDDVVIAEDENAVVMFATIYSPVSSEGSGRQREVEVKVVLEQPLGGRELFDAVAGEPIPRWNSIEELRENWRARA